MASTRVIEEERGTYRGGGPRQHNGYWAGDFHTRVPATTGATRPVPCSWR
jgi:hypothetical protein